jgi:hypothetical protein
MLHLPAFLSRVAAEYDTLSHRPHDTDVRQGYLALCEALDAQFTTLLGLMAVRFTTVDPYPTSGAMFDGIERTHTLDVYTAADLPINHPLAMTHEATGQTFNSIFRAVHDGLAHFPGRHTFGYRGEFAAFKAHARMLAGNVPAIHALATETLGQNAWYNFSRRNLGNVRKQFAPQYAALLPWSTVRQALTEVSAHV